MKEEGANNQAEAWYILHTYLGVEQKVKIKLVNRLHSLDLEPGTYQVIVPAGEDEKTTLAGFVLLRLQMEAGLWTLVRNTPGVTGFVRIGNTPTPFHVVDWKAIPLHRFTNRYGPTQRSIPAAW